jgi:filamentous hemagglutinin
MAPKFVRLFEQNVDELEGVSKAFGKERKFTDYLEKAEKQIDDIRSQRGFNEVSDTIEVSQTARTGVKDLEVGTYEQLSKKANTFDNLQHDHIPSFAAIRTARELELGENLTKSQAKALKDVTNTIAVTNEIHAAGRTFKGKNNASQVAEDALNLRRAAGKDFRTHYKNLVLDAITELHRKNLRDGIYSIGR